MCHDMSLIEDSPSAKEMCGAIAIVTLSWAK
jgi:hypothetical protein